MTLLVLVFWVVLIVFVCRVVMVAYHFWGYRIDRWLSKDERAMNEQTTSARLYSSEVRRVRREPNRDWFW